MIHPGRFDDKVAVVTGAAQGIGERRDRYGQEGAKVALVDRSELVHEVAEKLDAADGIETGRRHRRTSSSTPTAPP